MAKQYRITWGGLIRTLVRRPSASFDHEPVKLIDKDGHEQYVNIKFDAQKRPYLVLVRQYKTGKEQ